MADERALGAAQQDLGLAGLAIGPQAALDAVDVDPGQQAAADPLESRVGVGHRHEEAIARRDVDDLVGGHRLHGLRGEARGPGDVLDPNGDAASPLLGRVGGGPANAKQRLPVEEDRGSGVARDRPPGPPPSRRWGGAGAPGRGPGRRRGGRGPVPRPGQVRGGMG